MADTPDTPNCLVTRPDDVLRLIAARLPADALQNLRESVSGAWVDDPITHLCVPLVELDLRRQPARARRLSHMTRLTRLEVLADKAALLTQLAVAKGAICSTAKMISTGRRIHSGRDLVPSLLSQIQRLPACVMAGLTTLVLHTVPLSCVRCLALDLRLTCPQLTDLQLVSVHGDVATADEQSTVWCELWASLAGLNRLSRLGLRYCSADLAYLAQVQQLSSLRIDSCNNMGATLGLSRMTRLTELQAHLFPSDGRLSGLSSLTRLQTLDVTDDQNCDDIAAVGQVLPHLSRITSRISLIELLTPNLHTLVEMAALPTHLAALHLPEMGLAGTLLSSLRYLTELSCKSMQLPVLREGLVLDQLRALSCRQIVSTLDPDEEAFQFTPTPLHALCPNLERLDMAETYPTVKHAAHGDGFHMGWLNLVWPPNSAFSCMSHLTVPSHHVFAQMGRSFPRLQSLCLKADASRPVPWMLPHAENLTELRLVNPSDRYVKTALPTARLLTTLILQGDGDREPCGPLTDAALFGLQSELSEPCLRDITIQGCDRITAVGVAYMAAVPSVESIRVERCLRFTRAQAPGVLRRVGRPLLDLTVIDFNVDDVQ